MYISLMVLLLLHCVLVKPEKFATREGTCGPNNKISYSETTLPSIEIDDSQIYFVSTNNQIIFLRTTDGHIYRSGDEGISWEKQTVKEIMPNYAGDSILDMFHAQVNDQNITMIFLGNGDGKFWVSQDGGKSYYYHNSLPTNVFRLYLHSSNSNFLMARRKIGIGTEHEIWLGDLSKILSNSTENAWTKLTDNIPARSRISWSNFAQTNPNRIYTMRFSTPQKSSTACELIYSDDFFATIKVIPLSNVYTWYDIEPNKFVVITCANYICNSKQMYISENAGNTFHLAVFPDYRKETKEESNFYVYEITDDAIWTRVEGECPSQSTLCWGTMFHSDSADKAFTLSLPYQRLWDFTKYESVEGIYIANQYLTGGGNPEPGDAVRSLITYDKGSEWNLLYPPSKNSHGQPYSNSFNPGKPCTPEFGCSLHIHGWSSPNPLGYFYSIPNAIGLMIASGNVGERLEERGDKVNLYISSNGGSNWTEVREGMWVPEIGDHGSIITLIDPTKQSEEVLYTITNPEDQSEWRSCKFTPPSSGPSPYSLLISNIRVSEGWDSTRFIMYGQRRNLSSGAYNAVVIHLNFDNEFSGKCGPSDFESFTPRDIHGNCVMGKATTYQRKSTNATCYYGEEHQLSTQTKICECQTEDYECDHCFSRPSLGAACQLECIVNNLPAEPQICENSTLTNPIFYTLENIGYRLVDGDVCNASSPNSQKPKARAQCLFASTADPINPSTELEQGLSGPLPISLLVLLVIILIAGVLYYLWKNNERFYTFISYTFGINDPRVTKYSKPENPGESILPEETSDKSEIPLDEEEARDA